MQYKHFLKLLNELFYPFYLKPNFQDSDSIADVQVITCHCKETFRNCKGSFFFLSTVIITVMAECEIDKLYMS